MKRLSRIYFKVLHKKRKRKCMRDQRNFKTYANLIHNDVRILQSQVEEKYLVFFVVLASREYVFNRLT